jgi:hypothetical protein
MCTTQGNEMIEKIKQFFTRIKGRKQAKKYVINPETLNPKEAATARQESYIAVLTTHVNKENIRNGFFELDWNEYFILQLREAGYRGDSEEIIVDAWFKDLCRDVAMEEQVAMDRRGAGYINVNPLGNGRSEIS